MLLRSLPLWFVLLAGCGSCGAPSVFDVVWFDSVPYNGVAEWDCGASVGVVRVQEGMLPDALRTVLVHELWHAAGHDWHLVGAEYGAQPIGRWYPAVPGVEETAGMRGVSRTFELRAEGELRAAVLDAALLWNAAVGREMFVVP